MTAGEIATAIREERRRSSERGRRPNREEKQRERVERLLEWAVLLEAAEREGEGSYRFAPSRG